MMTMLQFFFLLENFQEMCTTEIIIIKFEEVTWFNHKYRKITKNLYN